MPVNYLLFRSNEFHSLDEYFATLSPALNLKDTLCLWSTAFWYIYPSHTFDPFVIIRNMCEQLICQTPVSIEHTITCHSKQRSIICQYQWSTCKLSQWHNETFFICSDGFTVELWEYAKYLNLQQTPFGHAN